MIDEQIKARVASSPLRLPRYQTYQLFSIFDWTNSDTAPPTTGSRNWDAVPMKSMYKYFAQALTSDVVYRYWTPPANMYRPDGVDFYLGWSPVAGWTSGGYQWRFGYGIKDYTGGTLGSGGWTGVTGPTVTPSAATDLFETKLGSIAVGNDDEIFNIQLWLDVTSSTANVQGAAYWIRFVYTAWKLGERPTPGTVPSI